MWNWSIFVCFVCGVYTSTGGRAGRDNVCAGRERKRDSRRGSKRMHMRRRSVSAILPVSVCYPVEVFINTSAACVMQQNDRRRLFLLLLIGRGWRWAPTTTLFLRAFKRNYVGCVFFVFFFQFPTVQNDHNTSVAGAGIWSMLCAYWLLCQELRFLAFISRFFIQIFKTLHVSTVSFIHPLSKSLTIEDSTMSRIFQLWRQISLITCYQRLWAPPRRRDNKSS